MSFFWGTGVYAACLGMAEPAGGNFACEAPVAPKPRCDSFALAGAVTCGEPDVAFGTSAGELAGVAVFASGGTDAGDSAVVSVVSFGTGVVTGDGAFVSVASFGTGVFTGDGAFVSVASAVPPGIPVSFVFGSLVSSNATDCSGTSCCVCIVPGTASASCVSIDPGTADARCVSTVPGIVGALACSASVGAGGTGGVGETGGNAVSFGVTDPGVCGGDGLGGVP